MHFWLLSQKENFVASCKLQRRWGTCGTQTAINYLFGLITSSQVSQKKKVVKLESTMDKNMLAEGT